MIYDHNWIIFGDSHCIRDRRSYDRRLRFFDDLIAIAIWSKGVPKLSRSLINDRRSFCGHSIDHWDASHCKYIFNHTIIVGYTCIRAKFQPKFRVSHRKLVQKFWYVSFIIRNDSFWRSEMIANQIADQWSVIAIGIAIAKQVIAIWSQSPILVIA